MEVSTFKTPRILSPDLEAIGAFDRQTTALLWTKRKK